MWLEGLVISSGTDPENSEERKATAAQSIRLYTSAQGIIESEFIYVLLDLVKEQVFCQAFAVITLRALRYMTFYISSQWRVSKGRVQVLGGGMM